MDKAVILFGLCIVAFSLIVWMLSERKYLKHIRENWCGDGKKKIKIIVTKRTDDFHACVEGQPGLWDRGRTKNEAVGDLIQTHADFFENSKGLKVLWNEKDEWTRRYLAQYA